MTRVAIVTQQRTGSTLLLRCLNAHSQAWCPTVEFYVKRRWWDNLLCICQSADMLNDFYAEGLIRPELLESLSSDHPFRDPGTHKGSAPVRGAKIMHNQLLTTPRLDRYVVTNTDIRIIHLRRENLLKQHVSNMLNKRKRIYRRASHTTKPVPVARIRINPRYAIVKMRMSKMLYAWYDRRLSRHPKIEMVYEEMIGGKGLSDSATALVCAFLGVPPEPLETDLVKMNPDDLRLIITNYDEVARALVGTEFEQYLD